MSLVKGIFKKFKELKLAHEDAKLGRKLVGSDRHQNRYYQYFDEDGTETKRSCEYASRTFTEEDIDPYWVAWLKKLQREPPSEEQLHEMYESETKFRQAAYDYEKRDAEMMAKYRAEKEKQSKAEMPGSTQSQGQGKEFEPGRWMPKKK